MIESLPESEARIRRAWQARDNEAMLDGVHYLNGACRYCGTPRLERAARELEEGLKTEVDDGRLEHLVAALLDPRDQQLSKKEIDGIRELIKQK